MYEGYTLIYVKVYEANIVGIELLRMYTIMKRTILPL